MPTAAGYLTRLALRREALVTSPTWPAAVPAVVNVLLPILSHDLDERPGFESQARVSPGFLQAGTQTRRRVTGPTTLLATYNGLAVLWALTLGRMAYRLGGTDNPETLATGAYQHTMELAPVLHAHAWELGCGVQLGEVLIGQQLALRATLCADMQVSIWEFTSCMVRTLDLSASPAGVIIDLTWIGHSLDQASATNPDMSAVNSPAWKPILFHHLEFRLGAFSASTALDSSNAVPLESFRIALDNQLEGRQTETSGLYMAEPRRQAPASLVGGFVVPRYEADTYTAWAHANTPLMASAVFTGPEIGATGEFYELAIWLPTLTLSIANLDTGGPGQLRQAFSFEATSPSALAAGFPVGQSAETPMVVQVTDDDAQHPLYAA